MWRFLLSKTILTLRSFSYPTLPARCCHLLLIWLINYLKTKTNGIDSSIRFLPTSIDFSSFPLSKRTSQCKHDPLTILPIGRVETCIGTLLFKYVSTLTLQDANLLVIIRKREILFCSIFPRLLFFNNYDYDDGNFFKAGITDFLISHVIEQLPNIGTICFSSIEIFNSNRYYSLIVVDFALKI